MVESQKNETKKEKASHLKAKGKKTERHSPLKTEGSDRESER
jgi:hypothetical protein